MHNARKDQQSKAGYYYPYGRLPSSMDSADGTRHIGQSPNKIKNGVEKNKDTSNSWIIDPIDGTVNFLHGIPHFAISIALKSNDDA